MNNRRYKAIKCLLLATTILSSGCVSLSKEIVLANEGAPHGELYVKRESAFQAGGVRMYLGISDQYFLALRSGEDARLEIDAGGYTLQAKAHASPAHELDVNIEPNQTTCLLARPNPDGLGAILIPLIANAVSTFVLEEVDCAGEEEK